MDDATCSINEEEFLHQFNLSKRNKDTQRLVKKHPRTRSKSIIRRYQSNNNSINEKFTKRNINMKEKICRLKKANSKNKKTLKENRKSVVSLSKSFVENQIEGNEGVVNGFCRLCRRAYSSRKERNEHFASSQHIIASEAKKGTNFESLKEEITVFKEVKYPASCSICGEGQMRRRDFLVHHRRHSGLTPYHCVRCGAKFFRRCDLLRHIRVHIGAHFRFKCPNCPALFSRQSSVSTHLIMKHQFPDTRVRNYKCTECERTFFSKSDVNRHMKIHTGHALIRCDVCGKSFSTKTVLEQHIRTHTGESPFSCDQCSYSAKSKQSLMRHQRAHNGEKPFKCEMCSYQCSNSSGLKRHLTKHTGSKPYKCPYCAYRSSNIENLRKHVKKTRKHRGLKVYPCKECAFSTDDGCEYIKHLKKHHYPDLDEECASATKLSGILITEKQPQPADGASDSVLTTAARSDASPDLPTPLDPPEIEMMIVSEPQPTPTTSSPTYVGDNMRPAIMTTIDEVLLSAFIKIPNLQHVILPVVEGNSPVTLVIGSDSNPEGIEENMQLSALDSATDSLSEPSLSKSQSDCATSSGRQRFIISSSGIQTYDKQS